MIVNLLVYHSFLIMLAFKELLGYEIYYNLRGREERNGIGFAIS